MSVPIASGSSDPVNASFDGRIVDRRLVGVGDAEQLWCLAVERGLEVGLRRDQHQDEHDREADQADVQARAAGSGRSPAMPSATSPDVSAMTMIETTNVPLSEPKKPTPSARAEQGGERLDELDLEDRAVDRRPEREDEPPAAWPTGRSRCRPAAWPERPRRRSRPTTPAPIATVSPSARAVATR